MTHPAGINGVGHGVQHDCGELGPLGPRLAIWQMCIVFGLASFASRASERPLHGRREESVHASRGSREVFTDIYTILRTYVIYYLIYAILHCTYKLY